MRSSEFNSLHNPFSRPIFIPPPSIDCFRSTDFRLLIRLAEPLPIRVGRIVLISSNEVRQRHDLLVACLSFSFCRYINSNSNPGMLSHGVVWLLASFNCSVMVVPCIQKWCEVHEFSSVDVVRSFPVRGAGLFRWVVLAGFCGEAPGQSRFPQLPVAPVFPSTEYLQAQPPTTSRQTTTDERESQFDHSRLRIDLGLHVVMNDVCQGCPMFFYWDIRLLPGR